MQTSSTIVQNLQRRSTATLTRMYSATEGHRRNAAVQSTPSGIQLTCSSEGNMLRPPVSLRDHELINRFLHQAAPNAPLPCN